MSSRQHAMKISPFLYGSVGSFIVMSAMKWSFLKEVGKYANRL